MAPLFIYKDYFGTKYSKKVDVQLNKETKPNGILDTIYCKLFVWRIIIFESIFFLQKIIICYLNTNNTCKKMILKILIC